MTPLPHNRIPGQHRCRLIAMVRAGQMLLVSLGLLAAAIAGAGQGPAQPAFPGAEGFGRYAQGGRGGSVYRVTSLADRGPGSLREALSAEGPRTVVFAVSGIIELESDLKVRNGYLTVAGQTAPGIGITLRNHALVVSADHVIIRFIRLRPGDEAGVETDALSVYSGDHVIIDHVSASWGNDETLTVSPNPDMAESPIGHVTVQWSIISESLNRSVHRKGEHGYGSLVRGGGGSRYSFHHNLWAHHRARMPRPGNYLDREIDPVGPLMDFSNNVFYNWGQGASGYNADTDSISRYNFINNYYIPGLDSRGALAFDESNPHAEPWFAGNLMDHELPENPWSLVRLRSPRTVRASAPHPNGGLEVETARTAFRRVLAHAGASVRRDAVDLRIVNDVLNGSGRIIDNAAEVGGWPEHETRAGPPDSDEDGMPDGWELERGLDPANGADGAVDPDADGYTNLEAYLNCLAERVCRGLNGPDRGLAGSGPERVTAGEQARSTPWVRTRGEPVF
jgi:hypothetical protein